MTVCSIFFLFFQDELAKNQNYNGNRKFLIIEQDAIRNDMTKDYLSVSKENFKIDNVKCEDFKLDYNNSKLRTCALIMLYFNLNPIHLF